MSILSLSMLQIQEHTFTYRERERLLPELQSLAIYVVVFSAYDVFNKSDWNHVKCVCVCICVIEGNKQEWLHECRAWPLHSRIDLRKWNLTENPLSFIFEYLKVVSMETNKRSKQDERALHQDGIVV